MRANPSTPSSPVGLGDGTIDVTEGSSDWFAVADARKLADAVDDPLSLPAGEAQPTRSTSPATTADSCFLSAIWTIIPATTAAELRWGYPSLHLPDVSARMHVTDVASTAKLDFVRSIGADDVIDPNPPIG